jgi:hypothetical protein
MANKNGHDHPDDLPASQTPAKARIRATGKTVPISSL